MSKLAIPPGWAVARLPQLVAPGGRFVDGDWVETKDQDPEGTIRLTQLADVGDGVWRDRSSRFLTPEKARELRCTILEMGDVLVARMPDPLGRSCLFPGDSLDCVTVVDVCVVRPSHDGVSSRWLSHFINSPQFRSAIYRLQSGSTRKRISRTNLGTVKLLIPPTNEQHRLADAIESYVTRLDDALATLDRVQRNLKRYRVSVLKAAVEGRLVPTEAELARVEGRDYEPASVLLDRILAERRRRWEEAEPAKIQAKGKNPKDDRWKAKYRQPPATDTADLPELPEGWCWATIETLTVAGPQNGLYVPKSKYGKGTPILRIDDYQVNWSRASVDLQRIDISETDAEIFGLSVGDIVVNRVNSPSHLGKSLAVLPRHLPAVFESNMMRFGLAKPVLPAFIQHYLSSSVGKQRLTANAKWAVNQASINQGDVGATPVPLPPEREQIRIAAEVARLLTSAESSSHLAVTSALRTNRLRQSILKWAFEGRLVDQDPTDEPASRLLERIEAERESTKSNPRRSRRRTARSSKA
jgi:type I restriction enzyme, S subunit